MQFIAKSLALFVTVMLSWQAYAATLSVPRHFELMYTDEEKPSIFSLSGSSAVTLTGSNPHQVVIRYVHRQPNKDEGEIYKSEPIVIYFNSDKNDLEVVSKTPRNDREAKKFVDNPTFTLKTASGGKVNYQSYSLPKKPGIQWGRRYLDEIEDFEEANPQYGAAVFAGTAIKASSSSAAVTTVANTSVAATSVTETSTAVTATAIPAAEEVFIPQVDSSDNTELQMLQFWYQRADKATQKQFQIWLIQQQ